MWGMLEPPTCLGVIVGMGALEATDLEPASCPTRRVVAVADTYPH